MRFELNTETMGLIVKHLDETFNYPHPALRELRYVSGVAEEVGEFVGAYHKYSGLGRRSVTWQEVQDELADVLITAHVAAHVLGVDVERAVAGKLEVIFSRGWRENPSGHTSGGRQ